MNSITLYNDDCMSIIHTIEDNSINLTLTDIPYNVVNRETGGIRKFDKDNADVITFDLKKFLEQVDRVTKETIYIFCSSEQVSYIRDYFASRKYTTRHCVWEKTNPSPVNGQYFWLSSIENCIYVRKKGATFKENCKSCVWRFPIEINKNHPTPKPYKLMEYLISVSSNEGDIVFDPCMGSGVVGKACKKNNRKFIGIELDNKYFQYAKNSIDRETHINFESKNKWFK